MTELPEKPIKRESLTIFRHPADRIDRYIVTRQRAISLDPAMRDTARFSVYRTEHPELWVRTMGTLSQDAMQALHLTPYREDISATYLRVV